MSDLSEEIRKFAATLTGEDADALAMIKELLHDSLPPLEADDCPPDVESDWWPWTSLAEIIMYDLLHERGYKKQAKN